MVLPFSYNKDEFSILFVFNFVLVYELSHNFDCELGQFASIILNKDGALRPKL